MNSYFENQYIDFEIDGETYKFTVSTEAIQDMHFHEKLLFVDRTGPITDGEIADWQRGDEILLSINWKDAYRRVVILRDDD